MMNKKATVFHSSFITPHSSLPLAERSHSGLVHRSRKPEWVNAHRGFESHPLRHLLSSTIQLFKRHHSPAIVPFRFVQLTDRGTHILRSNVARMSLLVLDRPRTTNDVIPRD